MKKLLIIAVLAAGCGTPFVEESDAEEPEVIFLEYGVWQAPPTPDVCVDRPRPVRPGPDAGRSR